MKYNRRKLVVNGVVRESSAFHKASLGIGNQQPLIDTFEKAVNRLDKAGFKYVHAISRAEAVVLETEYKGKPVQFVFTPVGRTKMEGYVLTMKPHVRTAGLVMIDKEKVVVLIDMTDEIPSMTLR